MTYVRIFVIVLGLLQTYATFPTKSDLTIYIEIFWDDVISKLPRLLTENYYVLCTRFAIKTIPLISAVFSPDIDEKIESFCILRFSPTSTTDVIESCIFCCKFFGFCSCECCKQEYTCLSPFLE